MHNRSFLNWRIIQELGIACLHRSNSTLHPSHPLHDFPVPKFSSVMALVESWLKNWLIAIKSIRNHILAIIFLTQIKHDSHSLKDSLLVTFTVWSWCTVNNGWDASICFFLLVRRGHTRVTREVDTYDWSSKTSPPSAYSSRYQHESSHTSIPTPQASWIFSGH